MLLTPTQRAARRARSHYGLTVYSRRQWGSRYARVYAWRRRNKPVTRLRADTVVQHITVTRPTGNFKADVRAVEAIGYQRFGSGISYNWVVNMATGEIAMGMPLDAKGTHTINDKNVPGYSYDQNAVARAIAVLGMPATRLSARAEEAIARLLAAMIDTGNATVGCDYDPHSKFAYKDCPCDQTRSQMGQIRRRAAALHQAAQRPGPLPR